MRGMHSTVYISKHSMQAGWLRLRVFSAALALQSPSLFSQLCFKYLMTIPHRVSAKSPASLQTLYNSTLWADRMGMGWQSVGISPFFASQAGPCTSSAISL